MFSISEYRKSKGSAFLAIAGFRLLLVAVTFLLVWLSGWASLIIAIQMAMMLTVVVLGCTAYEVLWSAGDRPSMLYVAVAGLLVLLAVSLPFWGTEKFWPAIVSGVLITGIMMVFHRRQKASAC